MEEETMYQKIGNRIRTIRKAKKMSQRAMQEKTGINLFTYGRIERGAGISRLDTYASIAEGLGVPFLALFEEIPIAFPEPPPTINIDVILALLSAMQVNLELLNRNLSLMGFQLEAHAVNLYRQKNREVLKENLRLE